MTIERPMFPPSRRVFINTIAALPIAAAMPASAAPQHPDADLIELGARYEAVVDRYYATQKLWSFGPPEARGETDDDLFAIAQEAWPLEEAINAAPVNSLEGLRIKALVAFREVAPSTVGDKVFSFDDAYPFQQLFTAVAELCGLNGKLAATGYRMPDIEFDNSDDGEGA